MPPRTRSGPLRALRNGVIGVAVVAALAAARDWIIKYNDRRIAARNRTE
jgi:hypothetical protein